MVVGMLVDLVMVVLVVELVFLVRVVVVVVLVLVVRHLMQEHFQQMVSLDQEQH